MKLSPLFFADFEEPGTYSRVDSDSNLSFFAGINLTSKPALRISTARRPSSMEAKGAISVTIERLSNGLWTLSFALENDELLDVFCAFCNDLVAYCNGCKTEKEGLDRIVDRYEAWKKIMASGRSGFLTENEIKGLLGEMYFLIHYMIPKYGLPRAVQSWIGPQKAAQDFVVDDTWYEVKTIASSSPTVTISSLEQLDSDMDGCLVVQNADKTSTTNASGLTINHLYEDLMQLLDEDHGLRDSVRKELLDMGYLPLPDYDSYVFVIKKATHYSVSKNFPALKRREISDSIASAVYKLSLAAIEAFKKEG